MLVNSKKLWELICNSLASINSEYVLHGQRVAFCMLRFSLSRKISGEPLYRLVFCSLFHDIGAYKTNEQESLLRFDSYNTYPHAMAGYLFLKYFSPLKQNASPILYHHATYQENDGSTSFSEGNLIHLLDRFDILMESEMTQDKICEKLTENANKLFAPADIQTLITLLRETNLIDCLRDGSFREELAQYFLLLKTGNALLAEYLRMLTFTFETHSPSTLYHSNTAAVVAQSLAKAMNFRPAQCRKIYIAGLVHDLGKIKTPLGILEKPALLNDGEMRVMRQHVVYTKEMIAPYFKKEIVEIASRHHEKLNGKGYPDGLTAAELSTEEKILCVADIVSALYTKRSYRNALDTDAVFQILTKMKNNNEIDGEIVDTFHENNIKIMRAVERSNAGISKRYAEYHAEKELLKDKILGL